MAGSQKHSRRTGDLERLFGSAPPAAECRSARSAVTLWTTESPMVSRHWSAPLRFALQRNPAAQLRSATAPSDPPEQQVVHALIQLLTGQLSQAQQTLERLSDHPMASAWIRSAADVAVALSILMQASTSPATPLLRSARLAEDADLPGSRVSPER